jgi:hypothetical protein
MTPAAVILGEHPESKDSGGWRVRNSKLTMPVRSHPGRPLHNAARAGVGVEREPRTLSISPRCRFETLTGSSGKAQISLIYLLRRRPTLRTARDTRHIERRSRHVSSSSLAHHLFRAPVPRNLVTQRRQRASACHLGSTVSSNRRPAPSAGRYFFNGIDGHCANPERSARGDRRVEAKATHEMTSGVNSSFGILTVLKTRADEHISTSELLHLNVR